MKIFEMKVDNFIFNTLSRIFTIHNRNFFSIHSNVCIHIKIIFSSASCFCIFIYTHTHEKHFMMQSFVYLQSDYKGILSEHTICTPHFSMLVPTLSIQSRNVFSTSECSFYFPSKFYNYIYICIYKYKLYDFLYAITI